MRVCENRSPASSAQARAMTMPLAAACVGDQKLSDPKIYVGQLDVVL